MRKSLVSIFFGFIFIATLVSNAQAQMCGCMGGMQGGGMMMDDDHPMWKHLMGLGLDDKQKDALKALRSKTMKDMIKRGADKQIASIELKDLLDEDPWT